MLKEHTKPDCSEQWLTVTERKCRRIREMSLAYDLLHAELVDYGATHGGTFVLFGSMVRGGYHIGSDVDILVDFPSDKEADAWRFAEESCWNHQLKPDVRSVRYCNAKFLEMVKNAGEIRCG